MWYVIQTATGKEQELVDTIHKLVPDTIYTKCFV
ncbi:MAG: transcription termination factor NusG, partial [Clostridium sp.]